MTYPTQPHSMSVMVLAAGHGKRMLPLTQDCPKPLLKVATKSLLDHHLEHLEKAGFRHIVVNVAYLGEQIIDHLKQRQSHYQHLGLKITVSDEQTTGALETAGGIVNALPLIESDPFMVINADIWHNTDLASFALRASDALNQSKAYLGLVDNPSHNTAGDFYLTDNGLVSPTDGQKFTFSGIGVYSKAFFAGVPNGAQALAPILRKQIELNAVTAEKLDADWFDIGTPQRLSELEEWLAR